jgi:hypothetical protein
MSARSRLDGFSGRYVCSGIGILQSDCRYVRAVSGPTATMPCRPRLTACSLCNLWFNFVANRQKGISNFGTLDSRGKCLSEYWMFRCGSGGNLWVWRKSERKCPKPCSRSDLELEAAWRAKHGPETLPRSLERRAPKTTLPVILRRKRGRVTTLHFAMLFSTLRCSDAVKNRIPLGAHRTVLARDISSRGRLDSFGKLASCETT